MIFFSKLLSTEGFIARSVCGHWSTALMSWNVFANSLVFFCYLVISAFLLLFYLKRKGRDSYAIVHLWFSIFVFSCSFSHLSNAVAFYWPAYRLFTLVDFLTSAVSFITVLLLIKYSADFLASPSVVDLKKVNDSLARQLYDTTRVEE